MSALLEAAMEAFRTSGVDAPVREIAEKAGVGLGTVYRHFPQRSELIKAVFQSQVDACANAAAELSRQYEPGEALAYWMQRYVDFISTKRGLAAALDSGDPAYSALEGLSNTRLLPALKPSSMRPLPRERCAPESTSETCCMLLQTCAGYLMRRNPPTREEWSHCLWTAL
jgi:AcrR family transcriptional regulator